MSNYKKIARLIPLVIILCSFRSYSCLYIEHRNGTDPNEKEVDSPFANQEDHSENSRSSIDHSQSLSKRFRNQTTTKSEVKSEPAKKCSSDKIEDRPSSIIVQDLAGPLPAIADPEEESMIEEEDSKNSEETDHVEGIIRAQKPSIRQRGCGVTAKSTTRIVGGRPADPLAWPWMAAIIRMDYSFNYCGGVLVTSRHVLTAAHCIEGFKPQEIFVRLGEYDFSQKNRASDFFVVAIRVHPGFDRSTYKHDIGILKMDQSTVFNNYIWPICLPPIEDSFVNKTAIVTGWGTTYPSGPASPVLMEVAVPVWPQEKCVKSFTQHITDSVMCAGAYEGGRDACRGDSGGPLVHQLPSGRWVNIGIISWGIGCGDREHPGVYTRVNCYLTWIIENVF